MYGGGRGSCLGVLIAADSMRIVRMSDAVLILIAAGSTLIFTILAHAIMESVLVRVRVQDHASPVHSGPRVVRREVGFRPKNTSVA